MQSTQLPRLKCPSYEINEIFATSTSQYIKPLSNIDIKTSCQSKY